MRRSPLRRSSVPALLCALIASGCARGIEGWIADLDSGDAYRRKLAVVALAQPSVARTDYGTALRGLMAAREDPDGRIGILAGIALKRVAPLAAEEVALIVCAEGDEGLARALLEGGPACAPAAASVLARPGCRRGEMLARLLGALGPEAIPSVLPLLGSGDPVVAERALLALETMGPKAAPARAALEDLVERGGPLAARARALRDRL